MPFELKNNVVETTRAGTDPTWPPIQDGSGANCPVMFVLC